MANVFSSLGRIPWRYYGVWVLPLGGIMGFAGYGAVLYTWPVFFPVIIKEFGWSAAVAATASSLARLEGGFEGPIVGYILDRWGARGMMLAGGTMMGTGFISIGLWMQDTLFYYIVFGVWINLAYNACMYTSSYKVVGDWWVRWRARAISIMILPTALAGTFGPAAGTWAIQNFGWRTACIFMGILLMVLFLPSAALIRPKRPEAYGLLPDGDDPKKALEAATAKAAAAAAAAKTAEVVDKAAAEKLLYQETAKKETDLSATQAMKSFAFWNYSAANTIAAFAGGVIVLFVPAHLISRGYAPMEAAAVAGLMMSLTYIGRLTVAAIGDIGSLPKWLMVFGRVLQGVGALCMANASSDASYLAYGYAFFYGVGYGMTIPLTPSLRGWLFGRMSFGQIQGWANSIAMLGTVVAPTFGGYMFDLYKNYYWAYTAYGAAFIISAVIFAAIKRPAGRSAPAPAPSAA